MSLIKLPEGWTLKSYETVTSTMEEARLYLEDRTVIWAKSQSIGRGRHQRFWVSNVGNLFCSFIIRPLKSQVQWPELAFVSALAVGDTLSLFLPNPSILRYKWPNDIVLNGRKVAGILLEIQKEFIVIGIGVNLVSCPQDLAYYTACLQDFCHSTPKPETILSELTFFLDRMTSFWAKEGFQVLRDRWRERAYGIGREVVFKPSSHSEVRGIFQDIDDDGNLKLQLFKGDFKTYTAGEIFFA